MTLENKFLQIVQSQKNFSDNPGSKLKRPINDQQISQIENLFGEPLPGEFLTLYSFANGQIETSEGIFLGEQFLDSDEIVRQLELSLTFVKPENKRIENKDLSDQLLQKIVGFYMEQAPQRNIFGLKKRWYKMEFKCGLNSYEGPYLYPKESTSQNERIIINIESYENIAETITAIHALEKQSYNWDELEFEVFFNGEFKIERTFYDFDNQINFSSTPENAIRKKYFHYKWLPLFSDYGGNYIGIDLDPDTEGKKGQIINFGRDEEDMIVLAKSLDEFFDFILIELGKPGNKLLNLEYHLHDTLKGIKKAAL